MKKNQRVNLYSADNDINKIINSLANKKIFNRLLDVLENIGTFDRKVEIFKDESKVVPKNEEEDHNFLLGIYNDLINDYNKKPGEKYSNIFFAYLYIFN